MVITSRTRNAVVLRGTWVRIPPSPPMENEPLGVLFSLMKRAPFEALFNLDFLAGKLGHVQIVVATLFL